MRLNTAVWLVALSSIIAACGSGGSKGSGGGTCKSATACGGDIEGTWEITSSCVTGDMGKLVMAFMADAGNSLPEDCSGLFRDFSVDMTGTMSFAGGIMTTDAITTSEGTAHYTASCVAALSEAPVSTMSEAVCDGIEEDLNSKPKGSATCSVKAGSCDCNFELATTSTGTESYTITGNQVVDPTGQNSPMDFCVSGTTLTLSQTSSSDPDLSLVIALRRQ